MFKKLAADALGLSDIGKIISPQDYDKTDSDDYVFEEDSEKIYFLIKTKADEYCFTNLALIHVDGENAISSKRTLKRYPYAKYPVSNVFLETAGKVDLDVEIKFRMGNVDFDIDVHKEQIELLKDLYKTLLRIAELVEENNARYAFAENSLQNAAKVLTSTRSEEQSLSAEFKQITEYGFSFLEEAHQNYRRKDFGAVFEKYLNN